MDDARVNSSTTLNPDSGEVQLGMENKSHSSLAMKVTKQRDTEQADGTPYQPDNAKSLQYEQPRQRLVNKQSKIR